MNLIDSDYLLNNIIEWRAMLTDENEKKNAYKSNSLYTGKRHYC